MASRSCALLALLLLQHGLSMIQCDPVTTPATMTPPDPQVLSTGHGSSFDLPMEPNATTTYPVGDHENSTSLHDAFEPSMALHLAHEPTRTGGRSYRDEVSQKTREARQPASQHPMSFSFGQKKGGGPTPSPMFDPSDTPHQNPFFSTQPPFHSSYDTLYSPPNTYPSREYSTLPSFLTKPRSFHLVMEQAALVFDNSSAEENNSKSLGDEGSQLSYTTGIPTGRFRVSATEPYIDPVTPLQVTAQVGSTARLSCFVNNLGQRSVSWVRHRDIHVLTVGHFTFTNDGRFEAYNEDGSNEWVLTIRFPTKSDTGIYECQVNTKPITSQLILLEVVQPRAVIVSGREVYLNQGSTLHLRCNVFDAPRPLDFLLWYHGQKVASYEDARVHIEVVEDDNGTWSTLNLEAATEKDSGTYVCSPSNTREAAVRVHVLRNGEHPAAMQTNGGPSGLKKSSFLLSLLLLLLLLRLLEAARWWGPEYPYFESSRSQID
ncbi:uncharacterized protein LOC143024353 [Oratosquilla oratoria]|uniref:uncharacterized protein LOC143024353 n=1 Tax=Oratosquilla oratoria TaxID=337810 RepID=UPI003F76D48C